MTIKIDNLTGKLQTTSLAADEVQAVLAALSLTAERWSPLATAPVEAVPGGTSALHQKLVEKGALISGEPPQVTPDLARAVQTLARPGCSALLRMGNWQEYTTATFFGGEGFEDHSLVSCRRDSKDQFQITGALSKEHAISLLHPFLNLDGPTVELPQRFELNYAEYLLFLAVADAFRQAHMEALLDRRIEKAWKVTREDVVSVLHKGFSFRDARWLVSIAELLSPLPLEWGHESVTAGLEGLASRGLLESAGRDGSGPYRLTRDLEIFCGAASAVEGYASVQIDDQIDEQGGRRILYLMLVRTPACLWLFAFSDLASGAPRVSAFAASSFFVRQALAEILERSRVGTPPPAPPTPPAEAAAVTERACPSCGTAVPADHRFCGQCGTDLGIAAPEAEEPPAIRCSNCGTVYEEPVKFCGECGQPMGS